MLWPSLNNHVKKTNVKFMVLLDFAQTFIFTFRFNGVADHGKVLAEVLVEQVADYDASAAEDAYRSAWFGNEDALRTWMQEVGFAAFDIQGVTAALHSHRDADRRLKVTPNQLHTAGFRDVPALEHV